MSEHIPCKNSDCKRTILPATVQKTGGYCLPCYKAIKNKEYEEYIAKNKKDVDLYEGIDDMVEIIKIMNKPKKYDPLINYVKCKKTIEEIYSSLTNEDVKRLKIYVFELIRNDDLNTTKKILLPLVCISNAKIEECLVAMIEKNYYYPGILFKDASDGISEELINRINSDSEKRNTILCALSWIGNSKVVELFDSWHQRPPSWKSELYVSPESYSTEAGWELNEKGMRKNLFFNECYGFEKKELANENPLIILNEHEVKCRWCGTKMTTLFDFDLANQKFNFLDIVGSRLRIATCHICTCYGIFYTDVDFSGSSMWSEFNTKPEYLPQINPDEEYLSLKKPLSLSETKRSAYFVADWLLGISASQVGGHPTWIQGAEYPLCPKCGKHMIFIGQLECSDFEEYREGIYYTFLCKECYIAATHYQQT